MGKISASLSTSKNKAVALGLIIFLLFTLFVVNNRVHAQAMCGGGDLNCDGRFTIADLVTLLTIYGFNTSQADLDSSGAVDNVDSSILISKIANTFTPLPTPDPNAPAYPLYLASKEIVPNFCTTGLVPGGGTVVTTTKSGNYSDPSVWSNNQVPNNLSNGIQILAGHTVVYDELPTADIKISCIRILQGGSLVFKTDQDTKLTVGTVVNYGYLEVGTESNPVQPNKKAEIVIADQPLMINTTTPASSKDPNQMGTGILVLKNGKFRIHGDPKTDDTNIYNPDTHAFIKLTSEPKVGQTTLSLSENILAYNWKVGDKILLPDSRQAPHRNALRTDKTFIVNNESLIIASISSDGKTLTLTTPLKSDHPGARDADGTLKFLPYVANLTRNVLVHSANPNGTRGHMLFSQKADIDLRYGEFDQMGRTKAAIPLDSVKYATGSATPTAIGTNQIGRYTIHFHHDEGPARTASQQTDPKVFQGVLVGNAIDDSSKWGITIHDTHFTLVKNNVVFGAVGSGIMLEQGNEFKNVFEGNFLVGAQGPTSGVAAGGGHGDVDLRAGIGDFGFEGTGIWSASGFSYFHNNVAASNRQAGFLFYLPYRESQLVRVNLMVPAKGYTAITRTGGFYPQNPNWGLATGTDNRGGDMYDMTQVSNVDGGDEYRLLEFYNNEAYGTSERGIHLWGNGAASVIDTFRGWNIHLAAVQLNYTYGGDFTHPIEASSYVIKNSTIRGDVNSLKSTFVDDAANWDQPWAGPFGFYGFHLQYITNTLITNNDIQGMKVGIFGNDGYLRISNNLLQNYENYKTYEQVGRFQRTTILKDNDFRSIPNLTLAAQPPRDIYFAVQPAIYMQGASAVFPSQWNVVTNPQIFRIFNYKANGQSLGDHRLYYLEQDPNYNTKNINGIVQNQLPLWPNMTNLQLWNTYGNAVGGAVATCNSTLPRIKGFACPIDTTNTTYGTTAAPYPPVTPLVMEDVFGTSKIVNGVRQICAGRQVNGSTVDYPWKVNDGTYFGHFLYITHDLPIVGFNFLTITDADIPAAQQLQFLDLNKNGVVDPAEKFKRTVIVERVTAPCS